MLTGHTGSVLCLQYDERVIITGSSDSTVRYVFLEGQGMCDHTGSALVHQLGSLFFFTFIGT